MSGLNQELKRDVTVWNGKHLHIQYIYTYIIQLTPLGALHIKYLSRLSYLLSLIIYIYSSLHYFPNY